MTKLLSTVKARAFAMYAFALVFMTGLVAPVLAQEPVYADAGEAADGLIAALGLDLDLVMKVATAFLGIAVVGILVRLVVKRGRQAATV